VGVVSVAGNLAPAAAEIQQMIRTFFAGKAADALRIHRRLWPLFKVLFITTNPVPVKAAMRLSGFDCGKVRLPLVDATPNEEEQIRGVLQTLNLLPTPVQA